MSVKLAIKTKKLNRVIEKYRLLLITRLEKSLCRGMTKQTNRSKNRILDFYLKNKRWPSRKSTNKRERMLGTRLENYLSKQNAIYDPKLRRIVMASGRVSNNKRKHDVAGFKKELLDFIEKHGRVPTTSRKHEIFEGEGRLRNKLDYYVKVKNDMTLLGKVYEVDKCHLSGIPSKFRKVINENIKVTKPLIRLI